MDETANFLRWAVELQALAQAGLTYGHDEYDKERYQRIREIAAEMLTEPTGLPQERVLALFGSESGYQTPKIDTRAAIFRGERILLVRERNGKWSLPGGWCDVDISPAENAVKEVREETGLDVRVCRVIAVQDREKHNRPIYAYKVCKIFYLCAELGGEFRENLETTGFDLFPPDALPELAEEKCNAEQIAMCFAARDENRITQFD